MHKSEDGAYETGLEQAERLTDFKRGWQFELCDSKRGSELGFVTLKDAGSLNFVTSKETDSLDFVTLKEAFKVWTVCLHQTVDEWIRAWQQNPEAESLHTVFLKTLEEGKERTTEAIG